jgi:hypothetical protein
MEGMKKSLRELTRGGGNFPTVCIGGEMLKVEEVKGLRPDILDQMPDSAMMKYQDLIQQALKESHECVVFRLELSDLLVDENGLNFLTAVECDKGLKRLAEPCEAFLLPWRVRTNSRDPQRQYRLELVVGIVQLNQDRNIMITMNRFVSTDAATGEDLELDPILSVEAVVEVRSALRECVGTSPTTFTDNI